MQRRLKCLRILDAFVGLEGGLLASPVDLKHKIVVPVVIGQQRRHILGQPDSLPVDIVLFPHSVYVIRDHKIVPLDVHLILREQQKVVNPRHRARTRDNLEVVVVGFWGLAIELALHPGQEQAPQGAALGVAQLSGYPAIEPAHLFIQEQGTRISSNIINTILRVLDRQAIKAMDKLYEHSQKYINNPEDQQQTRCRICYEPSKPLISVCGCSGSIAFIHEECALDWITKKIEIADRAEVPLCQICNQRFSVRLTVGDKKVCPSTLISKVSKIPLGELITSFVHLFVFLFALAVIVSFIWSIVDGSLLRTGDLAETLGKIFVNFISQLYVIRFFGLHIKAKSFLLRESMIQIVQVTLQPRKSIKN